MKGDKFCVIVPGYQEECRIGAVVEGIRQYCDHVIVVDDGSSDGTSLEAERAGAIVIKHAVNIGKGGSIVSGVEYARRHGFDFVIAMDGDGQHDCDDIPRFLEEYAREGTPVILGNRMREPGSMPLIRRLTNRFMSWLLSRRMKQRVPDTQCGFRLYRCDAIPNVSAESAHFDFDSEVLLLLAEKGVRIGEVPIKVIYGDEKSKMNPLKDTIRFFAMLRRCRRMREG